MKCELKLLVDDVFDTYPSVEAETDTFISKKNSNEVGMNTLPKRGVGIRQIKHTPLRGLPSQVNGAGFKLLL